MSRPGMLRRLAAVATAIALAPVVVPAATHVREVEVLPGGQLTIDLEPGGSVDLTTWEHDRLSVRAEFSGPAAEQIEFDVSGDAQRVEIRARQRGWRRSAGGGRVEVRLPERFDVRIQTSGGAIRVAGLDGVLEGQTLGGDLVLSGLRGRLDLTTLGGGIELSDSEVDGKVETHGGNVRLRDVVGCIDASTLGGNVVYDRVQPCAGAGEADALRITTHGGNIDVPAAPHGAHLETLGGNITVDRAAEFVRAKSLGGNIRIREIAGRVHATTMGGTIEVTVTGGAGRRDVRLRSMGGDVRLEVPRGLSMDVDVTLSYTRNSRRDYEIRSDVELELDRSRVWDYEADPPRKYIRGRGRVGSGEHRIEIETTNGNVELRTTGR